MDTIHTSYWPPIGFTIFMAVVLFAPSGPVSRLAHKFGSYVERLWFVLLVLFGLLTLLFWKVVSPDYVVFSNDGPLGAMVNAQCAVPAACNGLWMCSNHIGSPQTSYDPSLSAIFRLFCFVGAYRLIVIVVIATASVVLLVWRRRAVKWLILAWGAFCLVGCAAIFIAYEWQLVDPQGDSLFNCLPATIIGSFPFYGIAAIEYLERK